MSEKGSMCPSAPWDSPGGRVFGVVGGEATAPKVLFLKQLLEPSKELEAKLGGVAPGEVFRVAGTCLGSGCGHHNPDTKGCHLAEKIVENVDAVVDDWAVCLIRPTCVWWAQEGVKACMRCPQIATRNAMANEQVVFAGTPG